MLLSRGGGVIVSDCFSLSIEAADGQQQSLPSLLSQTIAERQMAFAEVSVALDCRLFTQHNIHSDLTDPHQIANTIRFDAEEAIATDATELAIAFEVISTDQTGSDITVFTAQRHRAGEILSGLQQAGLDPMAMEPDIVCLARFLRHNFDSDAESDVLFAILSENCCYIIYPAQSPDSPAVRSFLISPSQDKTDVLAREIPLTIASQKSQTPLSRLIIGGRTDQLDCKSLAKRTSLEVQTVELPDTTNTAMSLLTDCSNDCEFAIAYGAGLAELTKSTQTDFRQDFNPYQGKKLILQKALRALSISLTVVMLAVVIFLQLQIFRKNSYIGQLDKKLEKDYIAVMFGKAPPAQEPIGSRLKREYRRILKIKSGLGTDDDESVSAKLTFIFEAVNKAPTNIDLKVDTISITPKTMRITGDTRNRPSTLGLFKSLNKHSKLKVSQQNLKQAGNRDKFTVTLEPK